MAIKNTIWGSVQREAQVAEGITFVSTASHGGYVLSEERAAQVQEKFPGFKSKYSTPREFEEDCDASVIVLAFPECFTDEEVYFAVQMVSSYAQGNSDESDKWVRVACGLIKQISPDSPIARATRWKSANSENYRISGSSSNGKERRTFLKRIGDGHICEVPVLLHGNVVTAEEVQAILMEAAKTPENTGKTCEITDN